MGRANMDGKGQLCEGRSQLEEEKEQEVEGKGLWIGPEEMGKIVLVVRIRRSWQVTEGVVVKCCEDFCVSLKCGDIDYGVEW